MMKMLPALMALLAAGAEAQGWRDNYGIYSQNLSISHWLNPNAFVGILIMIIFFWVCYCVLGLLANVQTPRIILEKTIDWGKVEKTEE